MVAALGWSGQATAAEYWVEPGASGDGSEGRPFSELDEALAVVTGGDTVWLADGNYGQLSISSSEHTSVVTLSALPGVVPSFSQVNVSSSAGWLLRGLSVSGESTSYLVDVSGEDITVEGCSLMTVGDTSDWSKQDWIDRASGGISVSGSRITIRNNTLLNVGYGISSSATDSLIEGNVIENFSRDGLRGLGDHTTFQYNTVKNCYDVDDHHDDGFQSWSVGEDGVGTGEVTGVVLRGNTFIGYSDPDQPHRGTLQGIGCFDGTFVDWVVENNVVMTDHWHGITLLGARDSVVVNNTVTDLNEDSPGPPWISIEAHKDGTAPSGCAVLNNLTTDLSNASSVMEDGNLEISMSELDDYFVDAANHDLRLVAGAAAIDAAVSDVAPELDHDGIARPQGAGVDVGAFEWHDGSASAEPGTPAADPAAPPDDSSTDDSSTDDSSTDSDGDDSDGEGSAETDEVDTDGNEEPSEASNDSKGCSCVLAGSRRPGPPWSVALWATLALVLLRRRAHRAH